MRSPNSSLLVVAIIAACGKKAEEAPRPPSCADVIEALLTRLQTSNKDNVMPAEMRSNLKAVLTNRCAEDKWSVEALACVQAAATDQQLKDCGYKHLSQEQSDKLARATVSIVGEETLSQVAIRRMTEFMEQMCACSDKACADRVQEDMTKWSTEMAAKAGDAKDQKADEVTMKKMTEVGQRYGECMTKAMAPR